MTQHLLDARLLTIEQVADRFNVSVPTIRRAMRREHLPCIRLGPRTLRFDWSTITRWAQRTGRWRPVKPPSGPEPEPAEAAVT